MGGFWGLIPEVDWCRNGERGGVCPCYLAQKKDLGKGVWSVGLRCRRASWVYISARSVDSRACLEAGGVAASPGAWELRQSKPRLSPAPPCPGLREQLTPTVGLSGLRHPAREARVAQGPPPLPAACALRAWADGQQPLGGEGAGQGLRHASPTRGGSFRSVCAQPCAPGVRRERGSDAVRGDLSPVETQTPGQMRVTTCPL